jgi:predicted RNA-binding Zn-ribbon protein involved in translation (DUF1610 family)
MEEPFMGKGLRWTEQWMRRALWLVAFVFAGFLIGLGNQVVDNIIYLAPVPSAEHFLDPAKAGPLQVASHEAQKASAQAETALEQAQQKHSVAQANTRSAREAFDNWIATRHATARPDQDQELIARNRELDKLVAAERAALAAVETQEQVALDARQAQEKADAAYEALLQPAREAALEAERRAARKVFLIRLGITLPLLLVAGVLFKYKRNGTYWPFTWGFIFFALFAFFVELVPYLPSYGGYVRYGVGIAVTVIVGRYAIRWLHAWLARQKEAEALPDAQRRTTMRYDVVMERIGKGVCPSCERATNYKDEQLSHCPHCGIGLFDRCPACSTRKNAFTRYCFACGTRANVSLAD